MFEINSNFMKKILSFLFLGTTIALAQSVNLNYYLPKNTTYNPNISTPKAIIGHEVGEWQVSHDKLVNYNNPIQYSEEPLLAGYISKENVKIIPKTVPFKVQRYGKGKVMLSTDNTNFRAFWYGTNKLLMNTIFFGKMM